MYLGLRVVDEPLEAVDEVGPVEGVAADADAGALAEADGGGLVHGFVRQSAAAGHDPDAAGGVDVPGHDADLALARLFKIRNIFLIQ